MQELIYDSSNIRVLPKTPNSLVYNKSDTTKLISKDTGKVFEINIGQVYRFKLSSVEKDRTSDILLPYQARLRNLTYLALL